MQIKPALTRRIQPQASPHDAVATIVKLVPRFPVRNVGIILPWLLAFPIYAWVSDQRGPVFGTVGGVEDLVKFARDTGIVDSLLPVAGSACVDIYL